MQKITWHLGWLGEVHMTTTDDKALENVTALNALGFEPKVEMVDE